MNLKNFFIDKFRKKGLINFASIAFLSLFILLIIITAIIDTAVNKSTNFLLSLVTLNAFEIFIGILLLFLLCLVAIGITLIRKNVIIKNEKRSLESLVKAVLVFVESKDDYTAEHHRNVARLSVRIAEKMGLPDEKIKLIYRTGLIHDIGKLGITPDVLNKTTKLDESEFQQIRSHPTVGYEIIKGIHNFEVMAKIILQHHERLNGSGYPEGLRGSEIMVEARIIAVADVFEAMTAKRPYGGAYDMQRVFETLESNSGKLYDEEAVDACIELFTRDNYRLN
jgi:putative nucleotidyltransferase with HDIG domain